MSPVCCAFAYATELSLSTFSATAALIGAATFALTRDIAARSGSSSPAIALSSSWVSCLYSWGWLPMRSSSFALRRLVDRDLLLGVRPGDRTVRQDVGRDGGVDRDRFPVRLSQLLVGELLFTFRLVGHDCSLPRPVSTAWRPRCCGCSRGSSGTVPPRLRPRRR